MKISATDVAYVGQLANLEVAEEEKKELAAQLSRIVEHVELLNTLDTDKVEPTAQMVTQESRAQRADRVAAREGSSEAAKTVGLFRVPSVITER
jgi:aspartyl-tRNA(Asn)/glutamyl-tRNA(Gln) amidotransferase subunit C